MRILYLSVGLQADLEEASPLRLTSETSPGGGARGPGQRAVHGGCFIFSSHVRLNVDSLSFLFFF